MLMKFMYVRIQEWKQLTNDWNFVPIERKGICEIQ